MGSVSAGRHAIFSRPESPLECNWEKLVEAVESQRRYVQSSFEWVQTISGKQWKSSLPGIERKRTFHIEGVFGLDLVVGRDAVYFKAYSKRFVFTKDGFEAAKKTSNEIRAIKEANFRQRKKQAAKIHKILDELKAEGIQATTSAVAQKAGCNVAKAKKWAKKYGVDLLESPSACKYCSKELPWRKRVCGECRLERGRSLARKYARKNQTVRHAKERAKNRHNPRWQLRRRISDCIRRVFKRANKKKSLRAQEHLGCTIDHAKRHIESLFLPGMSWDNRHEWHIDHIYPVAAVDLDDPIQVLAVFNWRNLQPLWASENASKQHSVTAEAGMRFMQLCRLVEKEATATKQARRSGSRSHSCAC